MRNVSPGPGQCPTDIDKTAEAYAERRLSLADALRFGIHFLTCLKCAAAVEEAEAFVRAMTGGAQKLKVDSCAPDWSPVPRPRQSQVPLAGADAQMRFYVTGYAPPRRNR